MAVGLTLGMTDILEKLKGGGRRSIGCVSEVIAQVLRDPALFPRLFDGMLNQDPIIRMRSADAIEKITATHPEYLQPHGDKLLRQVAKIDQQEVRWHVAQMLPRLVLSKEEGTAVVEILLSYLQDKSKIVKTFSMEALTACAEKDPSIRAKVTELLEELTRTGSAAMKSRGRKLLQRLTK